jgi:hypothetical protein
MQELGGRFLTGIDNTCYRHVGWGDISVPITQLFSVYMEPLWHVSRGKTEEIDSEKRDYRYR